MERIVDWVRVALVLLAVAAAVALLVVVMVFGEEEAEAHYLSPGSSANEYLPVYDGSKYYTTRMIGNWDRYNCYWGSSCAGVDIDMVNNTGSQRLNIVDVNAGTSYAGAYKTAYNPDRIMLNTYVLDRYATIHKDGTIGHELGHALGFAHTSKTEYYKHNSLLYPSGGSSRGCNAEPCAHDVSDYRGRWVY